MKILVLVNKSYTSVSEIELDKYEIDKDFGSVQNFVDYVNSKNDGLILSDKKNANKKKLSENINKYNPDKFDELKYIKSNGKHIRTVNGNHGDKISRVINSSFQDEVNSWKKFDKKIGRMSDRKIESKAITNEIFNLDTKKIDFKRK